MKISVKTRLGTEDPNEIHDLIRLYNEFPICEVIVHARTLREMYEGEAHTGVFAAILSESVHPLVYNGNIYRSEEAARLEEQFDGASGMMIGRGLLRNPALVREISF